MKSNTCIATILISVLAVSNLYLACGPSANPGSIDPELSSVEFDLSKRLESHVRAIASVPHNITHYKNLEESAAYIEKKLETFGYKIRRQEFEVDGHLVRNIEATVEPIGRMDTTVRTIVVGAHYDSFFHVSGANDNGTGVAATLELSRLLSNVKTQSTRIRLVFFVNEEPPYFHTKDMGSWRYAETLAEREENVVGMMSLETLGAFYNEPGSQRYPKSLEGSFPDTGNFVAFAGLPGSKAFLEQVASSFRQATTFPTIARVGSETITGFGMSDHWAFYKFGFPAIMITDTAPFRNKHYHLKSDIPDNVQYDQLARITKAIEAVLLDIIE